MANVSLDEETLYYQYLINHNSTSTMLNAISGSSTSEDGSLSALSAISSLGSLGGVDSLGSLGVLGDVGSVSDFASILQTYLTGGTAATDTISDAAEMTEHLSEVLEESAQSGDTSSVTYKTVQELYEYFKEQTAGKAASLLGTASQTTEAQSEAASAQTVQSTSVDELNQAAMQGQEFDFSQIDDIVDSAFAETILQPGI